MSKSKNLLQRLHKNLYITILPFSVFFIVMLFNLIYTTTSYKQIVSNIAIANNYSISFRENVDYAMYRSVINSCKVDELMEKYPNDEIVNPYELINSTKMDFIDLRSRSYTQNTNIIDIILRDLNSLEKACKKIDETVDQVGHYSNNVNLLELNVYILTELIQEQIQEYIHYEALSIDKLSKKLYNMTISFMLLYVVLYLSYISFALWYHKRMMRTITRPIKELKEAAEEIAEGRFVNIQPVDYDEELEIFANTFNHATHQIQELIIKTKEEQEHLRDYEYKLFQAQINPHFLYNTLDTIIALIEIGDRENALSMITHLSDFFKTMLSSGRDVITIREEEEHLISYLEIQKIRYKSILSYTISFPEEILDCKILKLTLQPLVENALYHGLKEKRGKGHIDIKGEMLNDHMLFTIKDDGKGMNKEQLLKIKTSLSTKPDNTKKSFGLYNVEQRIKLKYGNEYGIDFHSEIDKGTIATVKIPITF